MPNERVIAKKDDWQTSEMPETCEVFKLERKFTDEELKNLRFGHIPLEMEDKWFWYMEGNTFFAHRSWTGYCIYIVEIDAATGIHTVTVNRDKAQYKCSSIETDMTAVNDLLDWGSQPNFDCYGGWIMETVENNQEMQDFSTLNTDISVEKAVFFHKPDEPFGFLSNWYPSDFAIDGINFSSVEQYIMYRKCLILGEEDIAKQILLTDDVALQQKLARNTNKYSETIWNGMRQIVVMRGLIAKFSQNEDLLKMLADTQDAYLVECAWSDKVWACGIGIDSDDKQDMSKWKGKNILGFALMEVRNMLCGSMTGNSDEKEGGPKRTISLHQGDITKLDCDCIVNAANSTLLGGGGVDGAIHKAAGPKLLLECMTLHGCKTGEAKITKGYKLPAKYIIHTVGPVYSGKASDAELLAACYKNSLDLAKENDLHSIAFPAISTGVYGYPLKDATEVAVKTAIDWLNENKDYAVDIVFCCFDKKTYDLYDEVMDSAIGKNK